MLERTFGAGGRVGDATDLADVLAGGGFDLFGRRRRLQPSERVMLRHVLSAIPEVLRLRTAPGPTGLLV